MKRRLRHPIRSITEPYGKAGLLVAILALVLATTGAAFAAAGLNSTQKKQVIAIAKKYAGKPGAPGAQGPAGTNGKDGTNGTNGTDGAPGAPGTDGKNVVVGAATSTPTGECPTVGGATVEVEGEASTKKHVCNGSPWTAGGTLPSEKTETGTFGGTIVSNASSAKVLVAPISFTIPLAAELDSSHVLKPGSGEYATKCTGTGAAPTAATGYLCLYPGFEPVGFNILYILKAGEHSLALGASTTGAVILATATNLGDSAYGTWAVTAP